MNITEIRNATAQTLEYKRFIPDNSETKLKSEKGENIILDKNDIAKPQNWQQEILKQGLDMLENKLQLVNSGSLLDRADNKPIETFQEALSELDFLKTELFRKQASGAQANISPQLVYELLTEIS